MIYDTFIYKLFTVINRCGFEAILDNAQTCTAGGHSKNTWLMDSLDAPHLAQIVSSCIPRAFRFFFTAINCVPTQSLFTNMDYLFWKIYPAMEDHHFAWILWYI